MSTASRRAKKDRRQRAANRRYWEQFIIPLPQIDPELLRRAFYIHYEELKARIDATHA